MHTSTQPTFRDLKQTMLRLQIKALETLERLMDDQELTGNEKIDKAKATERNRQRMSATQTLIHCRTVLRELRVKREQTHRIRQDERAARQKAPHQLATLRRLHKLHPDEYNNPDAPSEGGMAMQSTAMQGAESAQYPEDIAMLRMAMPPEPPSPSPLRGRRWQPTEGRMTDEGAVNATQASPSGCAADPSPQPSPSHFQTGGEGANPSDGPACGMAMQSMAMQGAESPQNPEDIAMLRMAMPPEPPTPSPLRGRRWQPTEGRMTDEGAVNASDERPSGSPAEPIPAPPPKRLTRYQIEDAERKRQNRERILAIREAKMRPKNH